MRHLHFACIPLALAALTAGLLAQPVFTGLEIFPAEEFAARRARVIEQIGDGVAIVLGTTEPPGEVPFRQNSQFFYLTGVTEPRASIIIDGRAKTTTLFLQPSTERQETSQFGPGTNPGAAAAGALRVQAAVDRAEFTAAITALASARRVIYAPFAAEVLGSQSQGDPTRLWAANAKDPWDGRDSREATFIAKLKAAAPNSEIKDLDPIVNALRAVKSPREIAVIREATRISGEGIMAAMREAQVGMREYELQAPAEYIFKKNGALGASVLCADCHGPEYLLHPLQPQHGGVSRWRPGAIRLCAGLQVLPVGRDARIPREREVHSRANVRCTRST